MELNIEPISMHIKPAHVYQEDCRPKMIDSETLQIGKRELSGEPVSASAKPPVTGEVLTGETAELHPINVQKQAKSLFDLSHGNNAGPKLWAYLGYGPFENLKEFEVWLQERAESKDPLFYAIYDKHHQRFAGVTSYLRIDPANASIEIGHIWFTPVLQNTRQATEALFLMMRHAFDDLGYRRLEWKCNALNEKSRRAARRLGFTFEGIFYRSMIAKGCNRDTAWYSIIDSEWPVIRKNFEVWLSGANFDDKGNQKSSLSELNLSL